MKIQEKDSGFEGFRPTRTQVNEWLEEQVLCTLATLDDRGANTIRGLTDQNFLV